nr:hypothetical protein [bacterium]
MVEEPTLLAHLVPRLTPRVEDAATEVLAFILNRSAACRGGLDRLLHAEDFKVAPISRVETQVSDDERSRPDMIGYACDGCKPLVVEAKFWAPLQEDQAVRYLRLLDGPGVLLFIAPASRIETLWWEIRRQMECGEDIAESVDRLECLESPEGTRRARVAHRDSDRHLLLVSWTGLLDILECADPGMAADIQQLRGLAQRQDEEAFLPIHPNELGPDFPRRLPWLWRLVDDAVSRGVGEKWMNTEGLAVGQSREHYGRYFAISDKHGVMDGFLFLGVVFDLWATGDTPLWLRIKNKVPPGFKHLKSKISPLMEETTWPDYYDMPIYLRTGVEYDRVLDDVVRQIKKVADIAVSSTLLRRSPQSRAAGGA